MNKRLFNFSLFLSLAVQMSGIQPLALDQIITEPTFYSDILATSLTHEFVPDYKPAVRKVVMTGYSSTPDQTDDTPFTTASGKQVRDGIVAANFLKFGTRIKIPELFGDKIFVVEDRMHSRFSNRVDIWFPKRSQAIKFGKREVEILVLL